MSGPESVELPHAEHGRRRRSPRDLLALGSKAGSGVMLVLIALLVAVVAWFTYAATPASQTKYVNSSKMQAVFLNTGQVYFGNVKSLNKDYLVLTNVYYLQSASGSTTADTSSSNQNVSLIKLGCELHKPYDLMVINTAQVTFWENLQSDGQVGKAVTEFQKANPKGQTCSTTTSASSTDLQNQTSTKQ